MDGHPAETLAKITGIQKREEETLKEYTRRVGRQNNVDDDIIGDGIDYVIEWQYSSDQPTDTEGYERFLEACKSEQGTKRAASETADQEDDEQSVSTGEEEPTSVSVETDPNNASIGLASDSNATGFRSGLQGQQPRKLLIRFAVIVVTAPLLGWMMSRAWVPGHRLYDLGAQLLSQSLGIGEIAAIELVGMFGLGLYLALLAIFTFDAKKRVQGVLLLLGTILALAVLGAMGVFLPNIEFDRALNLLGLFLGFAVGVFIESGQLLALDWEQTSLDRPTLETGEVPEFQYAAGLLFLLLSGAVIVSVIQAVLAGVVQVYDIAAGGIFLVMLGQFIQYTSETNYMTLGPERAGKSMLMLGLVLELRSNSVTDPDPNEYLKNGLERASNLQPGNEQWPIPSTSHDSVRVASFEVISGSYFPRRLELSALDYAGQHLGRVAERFDQGGWRDDTESVPGEIAEWLNDADTILFILDVERLVYPEKFQETDVTDQENVSWGLEQYSTILENTDPEDVIIVATKCDILVEQGRIDRLSAYESFEQFRETVANHLRARPDVDQLLSATGESVIHPVYFATEQRGNEYVPKLDETNNLIPVGYDHLIDEFRERQ